MARKPAARRRKKAGRKARARALKSRAVSRSGSTEPKRAKRRTAPVSGAVRASAGTPRQVVPLRGPLMPGEVRSGLGPGFLVGLKQMARQWIGQSKPAPVAARGPRIKVKVKGAVKNRYPEILTEDALTFLADLHRRFDARRKELLAARAQRQKRFDAGELPDFLPETKWIRDGHWKIAPIPADLLDRRVEITGPVDRKMIVNALNCGANVFMADFEDANSPTWDNNIEGQLNLKDRWAGKINFVEKETGKHYRLSHKPAVLIVRPRGWHLLEEHVTIGGAPVSGALFDFALYLFHNHRALAAKGTGPYFYLPKLETHQEARLWNDVFVHAQDALAIPRGTIKATVLIETLPAAFEMDEILYELRDHITGLNAGRWDYIFSFVKKFARNKNYILPDRSQVVMGKAFLGAYAALLVKTCHRRGAFAMGGMAAQIPVKNDKQANAEAFKKVRADKEREVREGHDGTWVAHPALVPIAKQVFDKLMKSQNQLGTLRDEVKVTRDMLLELHKGTKTEEGFRLNIRVGVQYIAAWLGGRGAVPIYNLMEDAATAEISRAQIWQWLRYGAVLDTGRKATPAFFNRALKQEMARVKKEIGARAYGKARFPEAIRLFRDLSLSNTFVEFLTIPAYRLIV